jgi:HTH-type transcriptional regulator, competence development regulator
MESFGKFIKNLRSERGLLLREVASDLQIDPSLLSRIESCSKQATREHVIQLAVILKVDQKELMIHYLSDKIIYHLQGEHLAIEAMLVAEKKIRYLSKFIREDLNKKEE